MEENNKKDELDIYNLYKALNDLLETINKQSGKELENIGVAYNKKLVEMGNQLKDHNLKFSEVQELTNTINNQMMIYIKEAFNSLKEYINIMEVKNIQNKEMLEKKPRGGFFRKIFRAAISEENNIREDINTNFKENLALEKYDEMVCTLKLFKIDKDIKKAMESYIQLNSFKGEDFISEYKKKITEQLEKIEINY